MIKVIVGGDFFVSNNAVTDMFDKSIVDLFGRADFKIVNLESPVTDLSKKFRILKSGPHLKSSDRFTAQSLKKIGVNVVTLANNHIRDYGEKGVLDTLNFCKRNDISTAGAGENLKDASRILYLIKDGVRLAVINISENEWSCADEELAGSYPFDLIDNIRLIQEAAKVADKVVVIIHGGIEHYNLPTPRMVKNYRFYAENGASIIIGHHTHCVGGNEIYNGIPIFYSLGNFIFTKKSKERGWYYGLLLELDISKENIGWSLHPTKQNKVSNGVELLNNENKRLILDEVSVLSSIISNREIFELEWRKLILKKRGEYLSTYSITNAFRFKLIRVLFSRFGIYNLLMTKRYIAFLLNLLRCESHHEVSKSVLLNELERQ